MKLSSLLSDGMVLQRKVENTLWGSEAKGKVSVRVSDRVGEEICSISTMANDDSTFEAVLPEIKAGGPYNITIEDEKEIYIISDVLVGDVFLLTGQSNMEIPVRRTLDLEREKVKNINNTKIRQFEVPKVPDFKGPVSDIFEGTWKKATQENLYDFSAIGFFFAELVYKERGVPVGLLQTAIGGIQIEALIPEEKLLKEAEELIAKALERGETRENNTVLTKNHYGKFSYADIIKQDKDDEFVKRTMAEDEKRNNEFHERLNSLDVGLKENYKDRTTLFDEGETPQYLTVPARWENLSENSFLEYVRGSVWVLKNFEVPKELVGKKARLVLGTIIDADETFINGTPVGCTEYRYPPRRYEIPEGLLKEKNTLVSRVKVMQRPGGFVAEMPYFVDIEGTRIPIDGKYEFKIGVDFSEGCREKVYNLPDSTFFSFRPCGLYNNMIYPLRKLKLKGMLFYQGESNTMYYNEYDSLMRLMASSIRECFGDPDLKMGFVELPFYGQEDEERGTDNWDNLRLAQERANVPGSVLVDAYDLGERYELHPQRKREVAERLYSELSKLIY